MQTRILVADDNAEIREILRILLTGEGYEVIEAKDGNEVLQLFDSSIDLIVLDIMMPNMDGIEATKTIRSLDRADAKSIPIIAMTANAFVEDMRKTKEAGMNEHLTKPVDGEKLLQVLYKYKKTGL